MLLGEIVVFHAHIMYPNIIKGAINITAPTIIIVKTDPFLPCVERRYKNANSYEYYIKWVKSNA